MFVISFLTHEPLVLLIFKYQSLFGGFFIVFVQKIFLKSMSIRADLYRHQ